MQLGQREVDDFVDLVGRAAGVDRDHAGVAVGRQVAEDGVGQPALFADVLEQPRAHRAAKNRVQHVHARGDRRAPADTRACRGRVTLLDVLAGASTARASPPAPLSRISARIGGQRRERRARPSRAERVVLEVARRRDDEVRRDVGAREIVAQAVRDERADTVSGVPRIGRPSGCRDQNCCANISCTRSSGASSTILISSRMTPCSRSTSAGASAGLQHHVAQQIDARAARARRAP